MKYFNTGLITGGLSMLLIDWFPGIAGKVLYFVVYAIGIAVYIAMMNYDIAKRKTTREGGDDKCNQ